MKQTIKDGYLKNRCVKLQKELAEAKTKIKSLKELLKTIRSWPINIPLGILNLIKEALR